MPIPRYNRGIPQINIATIGANPQVDATARAWDSVGKGIDQITSLALKVSENKAVARSKEEGADFIQKGGDINALPDSSTPIGAAYRSSAIESYISQMNVDSSRYFDSAAAEHENNPELLNKTLTAYVKGTTSNLPPTVKAAVFENLTLKADSIYQQTNRNYVKKQQEVAKNNYILNLGYIEQKLEAMPIPQTDDEIKAYNLHMADYTAGINSAARNGYISPEQGISKIKDMNKTRAFAFSSDIFNRNPNDPVASTTSIINGTTGNAAIDTLPVDERTNISMRLMNNSMQMFNYNQAQQKRVADQQESTRSAVFEEKYRAFVKNPEKYTPEERTNLLNIAKGTSEIDKVESLYNTAHKDIITPVETDRAINIAFTQGNISQEYLDTLLANAQISANDYRAWSDKIANMPETLSKGVAWEELDGWLNQRFPVTSSGDMMAMAMSGNLTSLTDNGNNKAKQENIKNQIREEINDGKIKTKQDLRQRVRDIQIEYQQSSTSKEKSVDAGKLSQQDRNIYMEVKDTSRYNDIKKQVILKTKDIQQLDLKRNEIKKIMASITDEKVKLSIVKTLKIEGIIE